MANRYPTTLQIVDSANTRFEHVPVGVPDYNKLQTSTIVTGKEGRAPGELKRAYGVAIDETTHHIFVANTNNQRIEIFSETGEYIYQLGVGQLTSPWGIAIHGDSIYVSCSFETVSKFCLTNMRLVRKIGSWGSNNGQLRYLRQLTTDPIGRVFIADTYNDRICIYDTNLNHIRNIMHELMLGPYDVKISRDRLYVLCTNINSCILVLTLEGDKLHSLFTRGRGKDVLNPCFFCFDSLNNFVISDEKSGSICVFSPEGNLLHTIGREGHFPGMFFRPQGVAITPNGRLVCVSDNMNYGLQIFCSTIVYLSVRLYVVL